MNRKGPLKSIRNGPEPCRNRIVRDSLSKRERLPIGPSPGRCADNCESVGIGVPILRRISFHVDLQPEDLLINSESNGQCFFGIQEMNSSRFAKIASCFQSVCCRLLTLTQRTKPAVSTVSRVVLKVAAHRLMWTDLQDSFCVQLLTSSLASYILATANFHANVS